jgi:argininosuccinate synthase
MDTKEKYNKIVLAYSGGLDTSIIIPWLKENYGSAEIIAVCTDVGQDEELKGLKEKAIKSGASQFYLLDIKEEFVRDYLFPLLRAGAVYEGKYLLGTSIARPLQAKHQVKIALEQGAEAVAHGCTGKGNDQVRFELAYKALAPQLKVIAPWRIWDIRSREQAIKYARDHHIPLGDISEANIYSRDSNIWHMSHEGGILEELWNRPEESMYVKSASPQEAPNKETEVTIGFEKGFPVELNGEKLAPLEILFRLNKLAAENGIGRADIVETRVVGMKSHGVYETPGGTVLFNALRELEMLTLDSDALKYKQIIALKYAELVYSGKWFSLLRSSIDSFLDSLCKYVTGSIKLVLYKGNIIISGRKSPYSLYFKDLASFGESAYDHTDATGFINLYGLSTGVSAIIRKGIDENTGQMPEIKEMAGFHEK